MAVNKKLLEARNKFRGQRASVEGKFDNSPITPGKYTGEIVHSAIEDNKEGNPCHVIHIKLTNGDKKGRYVFPFKPDLTEMDGIISCAKNVAAVLGDVLPGSKRQDGTKELDVGAFLTNVEKFADDMVGEAVEIQIKNGKKMKDDGTPWQQVYINRGLGADKKGSDAANETAPKTEERKQGDNLAVGKGRKRL